MKRNPRVKQSSKAWYEKYAVSSCIETVAIEKIHKCYSRNADAKPTPVFSTCYDELGSLFASKNQYEKPSESKEQHKSLK